MPTVDARPQARQWVATYSRLTLASTYSDWAGGVLNDQSSNRTVALGSAPPSAHPAYGPVPDKKKHKESFGIDPEYKIIGTVMRNQRRNCIQTCLRRLGNSLTKAVTRNTIYIAIRLTQT